MNSRFAALLAVLLLSAPSVGYGDNPCLDYAKKGDYDKAIDACTAVIRSSDYGTFLAYDNRGFSYLRKGLYDKAIADFTKALELNPKDEYAYINRALAHEGKKQHQKAIADWSKAIALSPTEYAYLNRARLFRNDDRHDEAIADYSRLIQLQPAKVAGYWFRAAAYYEAGKFVQDIGDYRKLLEIYRKDYPDVKLDLLYVRMLNVAGKLSKDEYRTVSKELGDYMSSNSVSTDDEKWWRSVAKYYLGKDGVSENSLLDTARNTGNTAKLQERLCDAYYAIGEKKLVEGDRKAAEEFFRKSISTNMYTFSSRFAKAMLKLMQEGKI